MIKSRQSVRFARKAVCWRSTCHFLCPRNDVLDWGLVCNICSNQLLQCCHRVQGGADQEQREKYVMEWRKCKRGSDQPQRELGHLTALVPTTSNAEAERWLRSNA